MRDPNSDASSPHEKLWAENCRWTSFKACGLVGVQRPRGCKPRLQHNKFREGQSKVASEERPKEAPLPRAPVIAPSRAERIVTDPRVVKLLRRHGSSISINRRAVVCKKRQCSPQRSPCLARGTEGHYPSLGDCARRDTSQQQGTHIGDLGDLRYPWHPWHGRKVRVHATLVKRGLAVARCSLEDVQPFRILEIPVWMFDVAACCRIRSTGSSVVTVEALRDLMTVLRCTPRSDLDVAIQVQHRYLLNAGGADVGIAEPTEIHSTGVVRPAASKTGLVGTVARGNVTLAEQGCLRARFGRMKTVDTRRPVTRGQWRP